MSKAKGGRKITMIRTAQGFAPRADEDREQLAKIKLGAQCVVNVTVERNPAFHNMVMSLLRFAFGLWDAPDAHKNFEKFREELTIKAGYYETYFSILSQQIHMRARSIAFGSMTQQEFEAYFAAIKGTIWDLVISRATNYTQAEYDNVVAQLMEYDR